MKGFLLILSVILFSTIMAQENEIVVNKDIQLIPISDSVYIHISWHNSENYGRFPSNGLVIVKSGKAVIIDTPMDNEKTERLLSFLEDSMNLEVKYFIAGHFHDDCLGGLERIHFRNIESIANILTVRKCEELGLPVPKTSFSDSLILDLEGIKLVCRFFGAGHSFDNITVYIPEKKILFGGCLVKSINSNGLGNLSDAVVEEWDSTVEKVIEAYPEVQIVVPGHGDVGGKELLEHTVDLVKDNKDNQ